MLERLGFVNIHVDQTNTNMAFTVEEEEEIERLQEGTNPSRYKVHVGSEEFKHLQDYDMNEMCARGMLETWVRKISKDFCGKACTYTHAYMHVCI